MSTNNSQKKKKPALNLQNCQLDITRRVGPLIWTSPSSHSRPMRRFHIRIGWYLSTLMKHQSSRLMLTNCCRSIGFCVHPTLMPEFEYFDALLYFLLLLWCLHSLPILRRFVEVTLNCLKHTETKWLVVDWYSCVQGCLIYSCDRCYVLWPVFHDSSVTCFLCS